MLSTLASYSCSNNNLVCALFKKINIWSWYLNQTERFESNEWAISHKPSFREGLRNSHWYFCHRRSVLGAKRVIIRGDHNPGLRTVWSLILSIWPAEDYITSISNIFISCPSQWSVTESITFVLSFLLWSFLSDPFLWSLSVWLFNLCNFPSNF